MESYPLAPLGRYSLDFWFHSSQNAKAGLHFCFSLVFTMGAEALGFEALGSEISGAGFGAQSWWESICRYHVAQPSSVFQDLKDNDVISK